MLYGTAAADIEVLGDSSTAPDVKFLLVYPTIWVPSSHERPRLEYGSLPSAWMVPAFVCIGGIPSRRDIICLFAIQIKKI